MREPDPLFSSRDLRQALDYHKQLLDEINGLDPDELLATPPDDLVERFSEAYRIHVPVLQYHKIQVGEQEAKVDVSGHPGRAIFDPNHKRTLDVPGDTRFRFVFTHRDDPNRELIITLVVFEVPQ
jgi:hypothetical protein